MTLFLLFLINCVILLFVFSYSRDPNVKIGKQHGHEGADEVEEGVRQEGERWHAEYACLRGAAGVPGHEDGCYGSAVFECAAEVLRT